MTTQPFAVKQQQCNVMGLILSWVVYLAGLVVLGYERHWVGGLIWLVLVPCIRWTLFRYFPSISRFLGYGRVDDKLPAKVSPAHVVVTFYSFFSCPFCPIVWQRLEALQKEMDFTLEKIDVTLKPQILVSKGISAVPVVEVGKDRLTGNATSEQLAALIESGRGLELELARTSEPLGVA
jgi:thiol-disulfide isomerase/thioredoxin